MEDQPATANFPCPYVVGATFQFEISPQRGDPFTTEAKVVERSGGYDVGLPTLEREARYARYLATDNVAQTEDQLWEQVGATPDSDPDTLELNERLAALLTHRFFSSEKAAFRTAL